MNLSMLLKTDSTIKDIAILETTPFAFNPQTDFALTHIISYHIFAERLRMIETFPSDKQQKDRILYALNYDYSFEKKIILSYLKHQMHASAISEENIARMTTYRENILPETQGMYSVSKYLDKTFICKIWPELTDYQSMEDNIKNAIIDLKNSPEASKITTFMQKETQKLYDQYKNASFQMIIELFDKKTAETVYLRGMHNFKSALGRLEYCIS